MAGVVDPDSFGSAAGAGSASSVCAGSRAGQPRRRSCLRIAFSDTPTRSADWKKLGKKQNLPREAEKYYEIVRDFLRAAEKAWGEAWNNPGFMVTKPVTLKAMLRVCADLAREDAEPKDDRVKRWSKRLAPWTDLAKQFRGEGFYERFPAKGQVERVVRVHRDLTRAAGI